MNQILVARPEAIVSEHTALEVISFLTDSTDYPNWDCLNTDALPIWREHLIEYLYDLSQEPGVVESIKTYGILIPILVRIHDRWSSKKAGHNRELLIANGHHRLAMALEHGLRVPVLWEDNESGDMFRYSYASNPESTA